MICILVMQNPGQEFKAHHQVKAFVPTQKINMNIQ